MVLHRAVGDRRGRRRGIALGLLIAATALTIAAVPAVAELTQRGDLFIRFDGGISPRSLPRSAPAPIAVRIEGTVRVPPGEIPPSLRRIRIALNRAGRLSTRGLPTCRRNRIESTTTSEALAACTPSLVGAGGIVARTSLPDQPATTVRADVVLFNGVHHGRPAILAHVYQTEPTPLTRIIVFEIRRKGGTFGTVIAGEIPQSINRNGHLKSIFLQLERRYVFRGRPRAYLSAACAAPAGFSAATFPFARASMTFDDGRTLASTLVRSCRVSP